MWYYFALSFDDGLDVAGGAAEGAGATSRNLFGIADNIINWILYAVGIAAVVMIIVGGIMYTTSAGDEKRVATAKKTIIGSLIGLSVAVLAWVLVNFVLGALGGAGGGSTTSVSSFASNHSLTSLNNSNSATRQTALEALYTVGGGTGDRRQWACDNGYFFGTEAGNCVGSLDLPSSITRQDMAVVLVRWMAKNGYREAQNLADNTTSCPYSLTFSDGDLIAGYAKCAVAFLNNYRPNNDPTKAVMIGVGGNKFEPDKPMKNEDVLRMLCRVKDNSCWD